MARRDKQLTITVKSIVHMQANVFLETFSHNHDTNSLCSHCTATQRSGLTSIAVDTWVSRGTETGVRVDVIYTRASVLTWAARTLVYVWKGLSDSKYIYGMSHNTADSLRPWLVAQIMKSN